MTDLQSLELEKAVHLALSRMVGTQSGGRAYTNVAAECVSAISARRTTAVAGSWAIRRLGCTASDLDNRWVVARANGHLLPREVVEAFFPAAEWTSFADFIRIGPLAVWQKVEDVLTCWARGYNVDGTRRSKPLAANTISLRIGAVHPLMNELCDLRRLAIGGHVDLDPTVLDGWEKQYMPKRVRPEDLGARPANSDCRAQSLRAIRLALRDLDHWFEPSTAHRKAC